MIPPIVVAISILMYYAIIIPYATSALFGVRISLFDTYIGLDPASTRSTTLPFVIWMMLTFIDEVPYTLEHAARLMGAGRITVLRRIVLPLVASGMVVTFLFVFILNWAEFLLALTLTHPEVTTLTVLLNKFQSASEGRLYGPQAAIGTMITIPVVILGLLIQKHLVKGFSFGTIRRSKIGSAAAHPGSTWHGSHSRDLVKTFGAYTAVSGINLDIRDGEFLIMVGPSGCGKTTTLNMISGLETPTSGEIIIGNTRGQRPGARRARARHGVPGSRAVPAHDGVREHRLRPAREEGAAAEIDRAGDGGGRGHAHHAAARPSCRGSARAARASASRSPAPSSPTRPCS